MIGQDEARLVSKGMKKFGGIFVQCLGEALSHADAVNRAKIKCTWPEYWDAGLKDGKCIILQEANK